VIFSVVHALLLRELPVPEADRLVHIWERRPNAPGRNIFVGGYTFKYWRAENTKLDGLACADPIFCTLTGGRFPERVRGLGVSANYLHVWRVHPMLGRSFAPDSDQLGGNNNVVILTHAMWQTRFGADPQIIDRTIELNQTACTVIGVLGPRALPRDDVLFLMPLVLEKESRLNYRSVWATVIARLKPGETPDSVRAELDAIRKTHAGEYPPELRDVPSAVVPLREQLTGGLRPALLMLAAAGALVLLIACANVANLLLARATSRTKEMAVRAALGASAGRMVRQVLTENIVLALLGGVVGLFVALHGIDLLAESQVVIVPAAQDALNPKIMGDVVPWMLQPRVEWAVLGFSFGIAVLTGVACGLFPALRAARADVNLDLKDAGHGTTSAVRTRAQSVLVVLEVALTATLLIGAGLFLRSFANVLTVDPGFNARQAVWFDLAFPATTYPTERDLSRLTTQVIQRLGELPGVAAVGASTNVPFGPTSWGARIGVTEHERTQDITTGLEYVRGDLFGALGIPLIRGRLITEQDNEPNAPRVAILSETLARALFADTDPLGRRVTLNGREWQVAGIVGDVRSRRLDLEPRGGFYAPQVHRPDQASVLVRSSLPERALDDQITAAVRTIDPNQPVAIRTLRSGIEQSLRGRQTMLMLVNVFAAIALVLACLGIYGVMAYTIGQRRREMGIRMALGASRPDVIALVLSDGCRLAAVGLGAGLVAAALGARLIASLLFGVSAHDPLVYSTVALVLTVVALASCWFPARAAAQADPIRALREN
jgi:predicted permease